MPTKQSIDTTTWAKINQKIEYIGGGHKLHFIAKLFPTRFVEKEKYVRNMDRYLSILEDESAAIIRIVGPEPVPDENEPDEKFHKRYHDWVNNYIELESSFESIRRNLMSASLTIPTLDQPPQRAEKLLHLVLPADQRKCVPGDLEEEFRTVIAPKFGPKYARIWYWWQAIRSSGFFVCAQFNCVLTLGVMKRFDQFLSRWGSSSN